MLSAAASASALAMNQSIAVPPLKKGTRGVAVANPPVPHPPGHACVVTLYKHMAFGAHGSSAAQKAHPHQWSFSPSAQCSGPWSKIVLEANFSVTPGRQYDRTASIWLDGVNIFYGTTQEPSAHVSPHWRVERNLTDYASLFRHAGKGTVILDNYINHVDNGVIHSSARLLFYPAAKGASTPAPANHVYGLDSSPRGDVADVQNSHDTLAHTFSLPRNIEHAYLDVIAQSQATDEQWYMCIDNADLARTRYFSLGPPASGDPLEQCGNTSFREVEVSIDGQPAGRAPVYPWTYTGGVDPYLWRPTPDIQTLNFVPYRINLTPFAALLDNGRPHTISVRVIDAHHYFSLAANLLVYLDHGRKVLTGRLIQNTLATHRARFAPHTQRHWKNSAHRHINGNVNVTEQGDYVIAGLLHTSHGLIRTRVQQHSTFLNQQQFLHPNASLYREIIHQNTLVTDTVTTSRNGKVSTHVRHLHYPLLVDVTKHMKANGSFTAVITMQQSYIKRLDNTRDSHTIFWSRLNDARNTHDSVVFNATGTALSDSRDQHSDQTYHFRDSQGSCYMRRVDARSGAVSSITSGIGCPGGVNHLHGDSWPNAM